MKPDAVSSAVIRISDIARREGQEVTVQGWLYNRRSSGRLQFVQIRDGSGFVQCVFNRAEAPKELWETLNHLTQESAIIVSGAVRQDSRAPFCGYELAGTKLRLVSAARDYPIAKKDHGDAFLLDNRHLWLRSRRQHTILRIRAAAARAIRDYLDDAGFVLADSPIFTANACEGTSTLFGTKWFDERPAYLSQSGQLYQEACAMALGKTYCFGPTFRAEKSKTRRHLNEFWMVEPEAAYMDLAGAIALAEDFLRSVVQGVRARHERELHEVLGRDLHVLDQIRKPFVRLTYDEAVAKIAQLRADAPDQQQKELLDLEWGSDFGAPHETALCQAFARPIVVTHFPAQCKAFYMKKHPDDERLSCSFDILAPDGYGEIIGGGQREDSLDRLRQEIQRHKLDPEPLQWYLDLRRYGSVPHAGFGLGLERLVAFVCGIHHLREAIPFPRTLERLTP